MSHQAKVFFDCVGAWCARARGGGIGLFALTMLAVAIVTAVLNLDTSVVFMTPLAINAARAKGTDETAFLYGTIFMSNSASLLLVGSDLTNLLIFARRDELGVTFARHMALPWLAAVVVTTLVVGAWRWRALRRRGRKRTPVAHEQYVARCLASWQSALPLLPCWLSLTPRSGCSLRGSLRNRFRARTTSRVLARTR